MSLEDRIANLTEEIKALSSSVSILTASIVQLIESNTGAPAATGEPKKRARKAKEDAPPVDPAKAETEVIVKSDPPAGIAAHTDPPPETKTVGELLANSTTPPAAVPTKEELIAKFQALVAKFGKEKATEMARVIIQGLGAANVSGIPEDKRAAAIAEVDKALAGA